MRPLRCTGILHSIASPGVDGGCVSQEWSHKCIVAVSCPSVRRCKGRLERSCMIAWCTQRRSDSKRFRGDAMPPPVLEFNSPPLYLPLTVQVQFSGMIYRSRSQLGVITAGCTDHDREYVTVQHVSGGIIYQWVRSLLQFSPIPEFLWAAITVRRRTGGCA
jgi:hypothetical protein